MSPEVLDIAPEVDAGAPPVSDNTPVDTGIDAGTDTPDTDDEPAPTDPAAPAVADSPAIVDGHLSASAKTALQDLAKTSPKLAKSIRSALFEADALRREIPGGLKEINQLREQVQQFGGPEAIAKTREEVSYFNELDQQFTKGDPRFVQAMIDTPEGQQGFLKLAPTMLEKFRELSPEMHDNYVARQQYQGMLDSDLKFSIVRMKDAIDRMPDSPEKVAALDQWGPLANYYNGVLEKANHKVEPPKPAAAPDTTNDERAKFENEKTQFVRNQWNTEATGSIKSIIDGEVARVAAARKLTDTQKAALFELSVGRLSKSVKGVAGYNDTALRFFANKDKPGFLKHITGTFQKNAPAIIRAAADAIVAQKSMPKPNGAPVVPPVRPGAAPSGATAKPAQGFTWVNAMPNKTSINFSKTTQSMILQGRAILDNGKHVQWKQG